MQKRVQTLINNIAKEFNLKPAIVEKIYMEQFHLVADTIRDGYLEGVKVFAIGKFIPKKKIYLDPTIDLTKYHAREQRLPTRVKPTFETGDNSIQPRERECSGEEDKGTTIS